MSYPILSSIILIPLLGALFIIVSRSKNVKSTISIALFTSLVNFLLCLFLWYLFDETTTEFQFLEEKNWIKGFINYKVGIDVISILLIIITI